MAERYLPKEIIYRPKSSFGAPLRHWLNNDLKDMTDDILSPSNLKKREWINPDVCQKMIRDDRSGKHDHSHQIYQLITLELWAEQFLK